MHLPEMPQDTARATDRPIIVRPCRGDETDTILNIINEAAAAYRGRIPADCWHEPYMSADALAAEIAAGIDFTGCEIGGALAGAMGIQRVRNVDLIRHAYVRPAHQGHGIGGALINHLRASAGRPLLVGTWAAADWAIAFYERHGFRHVPDEMRAKLLRTYWTISDRQIEMSVVLATPALESEAALALMEAGQA